MGQVGDFLCGIGFFLILLAILGQVRDLRQEVEDLKATVEACSVR